jgi:hypothetical protein
MSAVTASRRSSSGIAFGFVSSSTPRIGPSRDRRAGGRRRRPERVTSRGSGIAPRVPSTGAVGSLGFTESDPPATRGARAAARSAEQVAEPLPHGAQAAPRPRVRRRPLQRGRSRRAAACCRTPLLAVGPQRIRILSASPSWRAPGRPRTWRPGAGAESWRTWSPERRSCNGRAPRARAWSSSRCCSGARRR